jgi:hypothetical protein
MRYLLIVLSLFLGVATSSCTTGHRPDNVSVSVGINVPVFPRLVLIPGYPVYYDPAISLNYFFYDGLYWVYVSDRWYASSWYNGPWGYVEHYRVPLYVLRVPVRYYRQPPSYFRGWQADKPPRWDERWGRDWERDWERRHGESEQWGKGKAPDPAPVPGYQREYSGERYPREDERQHSIRNENYRYEPREPITQERFKQPGRGRDKGNGGRGQDRR